jgi:hypothetical protein
MLRPFLLALLAATAAVAQTPPAPLPAPKPVDAGDFKVVYEKVKNPDYRQIQEIFRGTQLLEETARALNEKLALPGDVAITLRECGAADASYEPGARRISLCYELVDAFATLFLRDAKRPEDADRAGKAVGGATLFVLFHEAGHALVDLYQLGGAAKEGEVDQIATLVLLGSGKEGEGAALEGASTFFVEEEDAQARALLAKLPFWSAHGFSGERFADILCWVYGRNPAGFAALIEEGTLPEARAAGCPAEYEAVARTWEPALAPYWKAGAAPLPAVPSAPPASTPPAPTSPPPPTP